MPLALQAKVLRMEDDGSVPDDNPFVSGAVIAVDGGFSLRLADADRTPE